MFSKINRKIFILFICFIAILAFTRPVEAFEDNYKQKIKEIQNQISQKNQKIEEIKKQKAIYEKKIDEERKQAISLKNQIDILNSKIAKNQLDIRQKENEIDATNLETKNIQFKILEAKNEISEQKNDIAEFLQIINQYDRKCPAEIILLNNFVSEFLNQIHYLNNIQGSIAESLEKIELVKNGLEIQEKNLRVKMQNLIDLKNDLDKGKAKLTNDKYAKQNILNETRGAEWKFQALLAQAIRERENIEDEITKLEKEAREKISQKEQEDKMEKEGNIILSWPVPSHFITCKFHDPDYPYKKMLGQHSGIDLRASQGTQIRAAASGYVARAHNGGMGFSYILIVHNKKFSTLYGHVNKIMVKSGQYIRRGEVIGKSGGMPGTPGAGRFCTGPHLHFEVRLNGLPVNPEDYLL